MEDQLSSQSFLQVSAQAIFGPTHSELKRQPKTQI
jgi:hypothetical protein